MENATDKWIMSYHPLHWYVMGHEMKVLSFGHMTLMERMMCLPTLSPVDVTNCIMICERDYKDAEDFVYHPMRYEHDIIELTRDIMKDFSSWVENFHNYFKANTGGMVSYTEQDEHDKRNGFQKKAGSPWLSCMRVRLLSSLNYNPDTINEAPFGRCLLDIQTLMELNGISRIVGDDESRASDILDAALKEEKSGSRI